MLCNGEALPKLSSFDWVTVLGGPMSIWQEDEYPWLKPEKEFIRRSIEAGKVVLGICLGAQLIAEVLGAEVKSHDQKEIGWFDVKLTPAGKREPIFQGLPASFNCLHWHGDTFAIPEDARHLALSSACQNQAFIFGDRVLGFQFHLEFKTQTIQRLVDHCGDELVDSKYIQARETILATPGVEAANLLMDQVLDNIAKIHFGV
jgi:GMP synthase (glutamine-hydrolysing)